MNNVMCKSMSYAYHRRKFEIWRSTFLGGHIVTQAIYKLYIFIFIF